MPNCHCWCRYGTIEECAKLPDATHAFITFQNESQAAMAFAELNEEMVRVPSGREQNCMGRQCMAAG